MYVYKGFNLLPKVKKTDRGLLKGNPRTYMPPKKHIVLFSIWFVVIFTGTFISLLIHSYSKIRLAQITKSRDMIVNKLEQNKDIYLLYHNISIRQQIINQISQQKYRPTILIKHIDGIIPPSRATQYTIERTGDISLNLIADSFLNAAVTWHKLVLDNSVFLELALHTFSKNSKGLVPYVLKGKLNMNNILKNYSVNEAE